MPEDSRPPSTLLGVQVWRSLNEVPAEIGRTVAVIGNFDGVHLGHRHVIASAVAVAAERELPVVAVTFDPHPMAVLRPDHAPVMLTSLEDRCALLREAGVQHVLVIPFSRDIAAWTPQEFIDRVLVEALHVSHVAVGANFRFGNKAAGDVATLADAGATAPREESFTVDGVPLDGGPQVWSSTYVRTCLAAGDVEGAAEALGRPYAVSGTVIRGDQRGRELGYPTANVPVGEVAVPADGVYAGWLRRLDDRSGTRLPAAISIGTNPTFAGVRDRRVEAYVLDEDSLDLYGVTVEVSFVAHIRGMETFDSVDALLVQMADDVEATRRALR